jgi:hypothetical protein
MREAYRAVERGVFNLDAIFENSKRYRLDDIGGVFENETKDVGRQSSLKTLIIP